VDTALTPIRTPLVHTSPTPLGLVVSLFLSLCLSLGCCGGRAKGGDGLQYWQVAAHCKLVAINGSAHEAAGLVRGLEVQVSHLYAYPQSHTYMPIHLPSSAGLRYPSSRPHFSVALVVVGSVSAMCKCCDVQVCE